MNPMKNAAHAQAFLSSLSGLPEVEELRRTIANAKQHGHMVGMIRLQAQRVFDAGMKMIDEGEDPETITKGILAELNPALDAAQGVALFYIPSTY